MTSRSAAPLALRLISAVLLMLAGCATVPKPAPTPAPAAIDASAAWPERRIALLALQDFSLRGRVAVAAAGEGFSAALRWSQRAATGQLQLNGPLGVGALRVEFTATALSVTDSRGNELAGDAARGELERRLGFALPIAELAYWVRGVDAPATDESGAAVDALDATGTRLSRLQQAGWDVDYAAYAPSLLGVLPQRLTLTRQGARIRVAIESWGLPQ